MDNTTFTLMPVSEIIELIKSSVKDSLKGEIHQIINTSNEKQEELMSIEEVSKFLHVSKVTIHKWKKQKRIEFYRIGRKIYFKKNELIDCMKSLKPKK